MPSIYPFSIDSFTAKINHSDTVAGDVVYAEHINTLQDSVVAIESVLGIGINGEYTTLNARLNALSPSSPTTAEAKSFCLKKTCFFDGNPLLVNDSDNVLLDSVDIFNLFTNVIIQEIYNSDSNPQREVLAELFSHPLTADFCGTVAVENNGSGSYTIGTTNSIDRWKALGADGIYLTGLEEFTREVVNELIEYVHGKAMKVIISGDLKLINHEISDINLDGLPIALDGNDIFLLLSLNNDPEYLSNNFKDASDVGLTEQPGQIYGTVNTINWFLERPYDFKIHLLVYGLNSDYYFYLALANILGVDGVCVQNSDTIDNTIIINPYVPLVANIDRPTNNVEYNGAVVSRDSSIGFISANVPTKKFDFVSYKIPNSIIDFGGANLILTSDMIRDVAIDGINAYTGTHTINASKIGNFAVGDYLKLYKGVEGALDYISTTEPITIQTPIINVLLEDNNGQTGIERLVEELLSNPSQTIYAGLIDTINLNAGSATINSALIQDLDASVITTGYLNAGRIAADSISASQLQIGTMAGRDRWLVTVYPDHIKSNGGTIQVATPFDFYGRTGFIVNAKEVIEPQLVDNKVTFDITNVVGYVPGNETPHSVLLETYLVLDTQIAQTFTITVQAQGVCAVYLNGELIGSSGDRTVANDLTTPFVMTLSWTEAGTHRLSIVYQYIHKTDNPSTIQLSSKLARNTSGEYPLPCFNRIDCYATSFTSIDGSRIRTGTIDADKINANSAAIEFLSSGEITADLIKTSVFEAINANITNATIDGANIGELTAGSMTTNVISAINADITNATIDSAHIGNLTSNHIETIVIEAINANIGKATIDSAMIENLTADYIFGNEIDTKDINIISRSENDPSIIVIDELGIRMFADRNDLANPQIWLSHDNGFIVDTDAGIQITDAGSISYPSDSEANSSRLTSRGYEHSYIRSEFIDGSLYRYYVTALVDDALIFREPAIQAVDDDIVQLDKSGLVIKKNNTTYVSITKNGIAGVLTGELDIDAIKYDVNNIPIPTWTATPMTQLVSNVGNRLTVNIQVTWNIPTGAQTDNNLSGYKVYIKTSKTSTYSPVATLANDKSSYILTGVLPNDRYYVKVIPFGPFGAENVTVPDPSYTTSPVYLDTIADSSVPYVGETSAYAPSVTAMIGAIKVTMPIIKYTALSGDSTIECTNFSYYEVYRYNDRLTQNPDLDTLTPIAISESTVYLDKNVSYAPESYRYFYKAVNTSGNKSVKSPLSASATPLRIGANDIVAGSITADQIATGAITAEHLDVTTIATTEIVTQIIESNTFKTIYGEDLDIVIPYIKGQLKDPILEIRSETYNFASGTNSNLVIDSESIRLAPLHQWDEVGLQWDAADTYWDTPLQTSGSWTSADVVSANPQLVMFIYSMSYEYDGTTYSVTKEDAEVRGDCRIEIYYTDTDDILHSWEKLSQNFIYSIKNNFKVRIVVTSPDEEKNVYVKSIAITAFKNSANEFTENTVIVDSLRDRANGAGLVVKRSLPNPDAKITWNETTDKWEAGVEGDMVELGASNPDPTFNSIRMGNIRIQPAPDGNSLLFILIS